MSFTLVFCVCSVSCERLKNQYFFNSDITDSEMHVLLREISNTASSQLAQLSQVDFAIPIQKHHLTPDEVTMLDHLHAQTALQWDLEQYNLLAKCPDLLQPFLRFTLDNHMPQIHDQLEDCAALWATIRSSAKQYLAAKSGLLSAKSDACFDFEKATLSC